uniref:(northern house mosquito) hypothetical protein n=1 Tax=Culex pipiens TaxID=7175 RepID=A0A8D8AK56_CULPI
MLFFIHKSVKIQTKLISKTIKLFLFFFNLIFVYFFLPCRFKNVCQRIILAVNFSSRPGHLKKNDVGRNHPNILQDAPERLAYSRVRFNYIRLCVTNPKAVGRLGNYKKYILKQKKFQVSR